MYLVYWLFVSVSLSLSLSSFSILKLVLLCWLMLAPCFTFFMNNRTPNWQTITSRFVKWLSVRLLLCGKTVATRHKQHLFKNSQLILSASVSYCAQRQFISHTRKLGGVYSVQVCIYGWCTAKGWTLMWWMKRGKRRATKWAWPKAYQKYVSIVLMCLAWVCI